MNINMCSSVLPIVSVHNNVQSESNNNQETKMNNNTNFFSNDVMAAIVAKAIADGEYVIEQATTPDKKEIKMTRDMIREVLKSIGKLEVTDVLQMNGLFQIRMFITQQGVEDEAMDRIEEVFGARLKSIKRDEQYVTVQYEDVNYVKPEAKEEPGFRPMPKNSEDMKMSQIPAHVATPSVQSEVDALKEIIAGLSPEAKAEAVKQGIIRAPENINRVVRHVGADKTVQKEPQKSHGQYKVGKRVRAEVIKKPCACGCGTLTGGSFAMGHDARAKGQFLRMLRGTQLVNEAGWTPTPELIAYAKANPQWSSEIFEYVSQL